MSGGIIETDALRRIVERRQLAHLWGQPRWITPRLCSEVFGDGLKLMKLSPINFRPNHFVIRVDSRIDYSEAEFEDWLDPIYESIENEFYEWPWAAEYGFTWHEDEGADRDSRISFADGSSWWFTDLPDNWRAACESVSLLRESWNSVRPAVRITQAGEFRR